MIVGPGHALHLWELPKAAIKVCQTGQATNLMSLAVYRTPGISSRPRYTASPPLLSQFNHQIRALGKATDAPYPVITLQQLFCLLMKVLLEHFGTDASGPASCTKVTPPIRPPSGSVRQAAVFQSLRTGSQHGLPGLCWVRANCLLAGFYFHYNSLISAKSFICRNSVSVRSTWRDVLPGSSKRLILSIKCVICRYVGAFATLICDLNPHLCLI